MDDILLRLRQLEETDLGGGHKTSWLSESQE